MTTEEMRKSPLTKNQKKMKKSSSKSLPSFLSLPYDVVINILARLSRLNYPILSLVSKSFRSLLASPDLEDARSRIGKPEKYLHVCLNLKNKPNPTWFILSTTTPNQRKLIQTSSFPYQQLNSSTIVSVGSETYVVGGGLVVNGRKRRSRRVFIIDCKSHQWRKLPKMLLSRKEADVNVIDGKIYVIGGCSRRYYNTESYGEVYEPKTQTWEPTTQQVLTDEQVARRYLNNERVATRYLTDNQVAMWYLSNEHVNGRYLISSYQQINHTSMKCYVDAEKRYKKLWLTTMVHKGELLIGHWKPFYRVLGLEAISSNYLISVTNPGRGNKVIVWWKTYTECETQIWCAEILIHYPTEFQQYRRVWGSVEWSENVFTFQGCQTSDDDSEFILHSALVTHDH